MRTEIVSQQNNAPTSADKNHHVYYFGINKNEPEKCFVLGESIGGGHGDRGGQISLDFEGLFNWQHGWKEHIKKSGCSWVIEIIENAAKENDTYQAIDKIIHFMGPK